MTSHENTLKEALMGLSKLQLPILNDISEKEIKEIQQAENAENKLIILQMNKKRKLVSSDLVSSETLLRDILMLILMKRIK